MMTSELRTIQQRGRSARLHYWNDWALRNGATDAQAVRVALELDYQMNTGKAPTLADQYRALRVAKQEAA